MTFRRLIPFLLCLPIYGYGQSTIDSLRNLLSHSKPNSEERASVFSKIGVTLFSEGKYDSSILAYYEALKISHSDRSLLASNYNDLGVLYSKKSLPDSSLVYYSKALHLYESLQDFEKVAILETNLSIIYKDKGLYEKAIETALSAVRKLERNAPGRPLASCYNTLGVVYSRINETDKSLLFYYKALAVRRLINLPKAVAQSYNNIGDLYLSLQHYDSALTNLLRALEIKRAEKDSKDLQSTLNNVGKVFLKLNNTREAEEYFTEALGLSRQSDDGAGETVVLNNLAELRLIQGKLSDAEKHLNEAEQLAEQRGLLYQLRDNIALKLRLYKAKGLYATAVEYSERLAILNDSLLNKEKAESLMALQARYEVEKMEQQIVFLEQNNAINQAEIAAKRTQVRALIACFILVLIIAALVYHNYRVMRTNKKHVELLLKELHHRVKNNLQMLSSVLSLHSQVLKDESAIQVVKSSESRVNAMALIHKKLYHDDRNRAINVKEYITELVEYLVHTYGYAQRNLKVNLQLEAIELDVDKAIPLGLIINELVSNAFKYAFRDLPEPELNVFISSGEDSDLLVQVKDNGAGFKEPGPGHAGSFGLKMVKLLMRELKGKYKVEAQNGTTFSLHIPIS